MKVSLALLLMAGVVGVMCGEEVVRIRRQDLNFPGATDNRQQGAGRPPTGTRTTTTPAPPKPGDGALTISSLGVVFQVPCPCPTTPEYNPVCGSDGNTYVNQRMLNCAKSCGFNVQVARLGVCSSPR